MLKQYQEPLDSNQVFLSSSTEQITWGELHANLDAKVEKLKEHGIGQHVVFILTEDQVTIDDYLWVLASIKNGGSATNAEARQSKLELDSLIATCKPTCIIRSNKIEMLTDPAETGPTILHPLEIFRGQTSGTTVKEIFEMYPFFWDYEDHENAIVNGETLLGCTAHASTNHLFAVAPEFNKGTERPKVLCTHGFTSTYNAYNLLRMYYIGGSLHFLNYGDDIPGEIQKAKPNCCISYPNAIKKIVDSCPDDFNWTIDYWECSGGHTPEVVLKSIEQKFKFKVIYNMMASTEADCHSRAEYRRGDPTENFYGFKHRIYNGELKLDERGILWYKYGTLDWHTDGDKFENKNGMWYFQGRAFDDVIFMKGGVKIFTRLVEALALEVEGVENVASCEKGEIHHLIYTGTANINDVAKHYIEEAQESKRPHDIYHVTEQLYFSGPNKLQKSKLPDIVQVSSPPHIIGKVTIKDHSRV
ncbi:MAG: hypothetical protein CMA64_10100 [Euryarchaeota archaeon]|nr:hypothetical protein [Euryarchaeota archaeon]